MVALTGYNQSLTATQAGSVCKSSRTFDNRGENPYLNQYLAEAMTPGGSFVDAISAAYDRRHARVMGDYGVVSSNEDPDACLWDAVKLVAGKVAGIVQPIASEAAAIGCGAIPIVGGFASGVCASATDALFGYVKDLSDIDSNRKDSTSPVKAITQVAKEVDKMPRVAQGQVPINRDHGPVQRPVGDQYDDLLRRLKEELRKEEIKMTPEEELIYNWNNGNDELGYPHYDSRAGTMPIPMDVLDDWRRLNPDAAEISRKAREAKSVKKFKKRLAKGKVGPKGGQPKAKAAAPKPKPKPAPKPAPKKMLAPVTAVKKRKY
jgi:hypothetical protein